MRQKAEGGFSRENLNKINLEIGLEAAWVLGLGGTNIRGRLFAVSAMFPFVGRAWAESGRLHGSKRHKYGY